MVLLRVVAEIAGHSEQGNSLRGEFASVLRDIALQIAQYVASMNGASCNDDRVVPRAWHLAGSPHNDIVTRLTKDVADALRDFSRRAVTARMDYEDLHIPSTSPTPSLEGTSHCLGSRSPRQRETPGSLHAPYRSTKSALRLTVLEPDTRHGQSRAEYAPDAPHLGHTSQDDLWQQLRTSTEPSLCRSADPEKNSVTWLASRRSRGSGVCSSTRRTMEAAREARYPCRYRHPEFEALELFSRRPETLIISARRSAGSALSRILDDGGFADPTATPTGALA